MRFGDQQLHFEEYWGPILGDGKHTSVTNQWITTMVRR